MGLEFEALWALLLLPVGLAAVWLIDRRYCVRRASLRRRVTLGVRLLLCAVLCLAGGIGHVKHHPALRRA